jgi:carboxylesterase
VSNFSVTSASQSPGSALRGSSRPPEAVAKIEARVKDEIRWQTEPSDDGLLLRKNAQSLFKPQAEGQAKGTVLLFHGYTAGPWQYEGLADKLHDAGFNVYAPRMPGHGLAEAANGKPSSKEIPTTSESGVWNEFIDEKYQDAAALGAPVYAVGLSGGANVALRMADRHEEVAGVLAMAPFLGSNSMKGALFPVINFIDVITFGLCGKLIDGIPRKEKSPPDDPTPRTQGTWGQALAMYRVGAEVAPEGIEQPLQLITTHKDILSGVAPNQRFIAKSAEGEPDGWFHFPAEDKVPHAMISRDENKNPETVDTIEAIIADFVESGKQVNRRPS